jgi:hypothetical protein
MLAHCDTSVGRLCSTISNDMNVKNRGGICRPGCVMADMDLNLRLLGDESSKPE